MAAGVHLAGDRRGVLEFVLLMDIERVEIGAQPDRPVRITNLEGADDTRLGEPPMHRNAERFQRRRDDVSGALFLIGGFRVGVDVSAPRGHFLAERDDLFLDGHGVLRR